MKRLKKIIPVCLLGLTLVISVTLLAPKAQATITDSGTCGENLTWTLDDEGTLTILGTGPMEDYKYSGVGPSYASHPWGSVSASIKNVMIEDGVTYIGHYAFYGCRAIQSVTFGESVASFDTTAFLGCNGLTEFRVDTANPNYSNDDYGVLFNKEKTTLIQAPYTISGHYTVPDGVVTIGENAFGSCVNLQGVTIPDSVITICDSAFYYCQSLSTVNLGNNVESIGNNAFFYSSNLRYITIPASVTSLGGGLFTFGRIYHIWVDEENLNYSSDDDGCLYNKDKTTLLMTTSAIAEDYTVRDGVTTIANSAFLGRSITAITIPTSVTDIGRAAFSECYSLTDVYYKGDEAQWKNINIGTSNEGLSNATLHYSTVDSGVVEGDIVDSGTCGENLTWTLDNTGTLTISGSGLMTNYDGDSRSPFGLNADVKTVIIESGVTTIGNKAFSGCANLQSITIPDSTTSIGWGVFDGCTNLTGIWVNTGNSNFSSDDAGVLFDKDKTNLIQAPIAISGNYIVPNSVTTIEGLAFSGCSKLRSVTLPNNAYLGTSVFSDCTGLLSITIPEGVNISNSMFFGCTSLQSVTIVNGVTQIGDFAFFGCTSLQTINIPESVTIIGSEVFVGSTSLTGIYVDDDNPKFSSDVHGVLFNKTQTIIRSVPNGISGDYTVPDGVISIGMWAFKNCTNLQTITIPDSVTEINYYAFEDCSGLKDVYYVGSETQWKKISVGYGNEQLLGATIHYGVQEQVVGDLTGDNTVNNEDVVLLLWNTLFPTDYPLEVSGDINQDDLVNNDDVALLLWHTLFPEDYPL